MKKNNLLQRAQKLFDRDAAKKYRAQDVEVLEPGVHRDISNKVSELTSSFERKITVLDIGCGTGRFFHSLKNVEKLYALDVSETMLEEAKNPIAKDRISASEIKLIQADYLDFDFKDQKFDFILSVGLFGVLCPFNILQCNTLFDLLEPDGIALFTMADQSYHSEPKSLKHLLSKIVYQFLPLVLKHKLDEKWKGCFLECEEIKNILKDSQFKDFEINKIPYFFECIISV